MPSFAIPYHQSHCVENLRIRATSAEYAAQCLLHVFNIWLGILAEHRGGSEHHCGRAETTLERTRRNKGLLNVIELTIGGETFDSFDLGSRA